MVFSILLFLAGVTLSAVAIYYSVIGLTAIFAAAFWPIVVMGTTLEISKLVAASWLKMYWDQIPRIMKIYMTTAVMVLMLITSMGIFGFLSKAHLDQNIVSGDVSSQIALIDEKIKIERENIANAQSVIKQMDAAVNGVIATGDQEFQRKDGTTGVRSAAERSLQIRRSQAKDRAALTKQIEESQARIVKLQEDSAPIRADMRKVEAEVGPIKYIAKLIYGDSADTNLLEKAVTWVIMVIVFVFDPLAVLLLLGSLMTYQWNKESKERKDELVQETAPPEDTGEETPTPPQPISGTADEGSGGELQQDSEPQIRVDVTQEEKAVEVEKDPLAEWNEMIAEADKAAIEEAERDDEKIIDEADRKEKLAMKAWKSDNPNDSLKRHRKLFDQGTTTDLPWMKEPYYTDSMLPEEVAESYNEVTEISQPQERIKPDLTEVIEPSQGLKLSDLKKKNEAYLEKIGNRQVKKPLV